MKSASNCLAQTLSKASSKSAKPARIASAANSVSPPIASTNDIGHFYTPNTHIGIALSVLFVGRIAYRYIVRNDPVTAPNHAPLFQSPLTLLIVGLTVGYYIVYQAGILIHNHDKKNSGKKTLNPADQN